MKFFEKNHACIMLETLIRAILVQTNDIYLHANERAALFPLSLTAMLLSKPHLSLQEVLPPCFTQGLKHFISSSESSLS